ncbi:hypothetical protein C8D76_10222 [Pasteurella langaaensis DSM 22999]|uniref:Lipoprotein n=1 Tax=Alitibacter langaaensis DSM 22999 TaxID=1122935 RepID=A0A2U0TCI0_9PAST|nr:hypothetical protein [Pasteurella langaaensis]PVX41326.1 hypothetical protein C8D76_10222 [Pasteurella langaaensis DSM 22999]
MKKLAFLLSITAMLAACSSPEPVDPDALPNGIMQPVAGTGAVEGGTFMPEVEQSSMPANMK